MEVPLAVLKLTQKWDPAFFYFSQNNPRKRDHLNKPNTRLNYTNKPTCDNCNNKIRIERIFVCYMKDPALTC